MNKPDNSGRKVELPFNTVQFHWLIRSVFVYCLFALVVTPSLMGQLSPVPLGRMSNLRTVMPIQASPVFFDNASNTCLVLHHQDITLFGGGIAANSKYRYDLSVNGGQTFTTEIGPLQPAYLKKAWVPSCLFYNPENSGLAADNRLLFFGATYFTPIFPFHEFNGFVSGQSEISLTAPAGADHYFTAGLQTHTPSAMTEGLPGEFWVADFVATPALIEDTLKLFKGIWDSLSSNLNWTLDQSIVFQEARPRPASVTEPGAVIAFSPDGLDGWVGLISDLTTSPDEAQKPLLFHSTDGGVNWSSPIEVDLTAVPWVADSLQSLWVDSAGNPLATDIPWAFQDFDLVVDEMGEAHLATVIGSQSASGPIGGVPGLAKFLADVHSSGNGSAWDVHYLAPVLTFEWSYGGSIGGGSEIITMQNHVQASRSADGEYLFFSWVDSDTLLTGFGNPDNQMPNLRVVGERVSDGARTCWRRITDVDPDWNGWAIYPKLAPVVKEENGNFYLPLVMGSILTGYWEEPCSLWYFGNEISFSPSDFQSPANPSWTGPCYDFVVHSPKPDLPMAFTVSVGPNPTTGAARFIIEAGSPTVADLKISNSQGETVLSREGIAVDHSGWRWEADFSLLPAGIYFYQVLTEGVLQCGKIILLK